MRINRILSSCALVLSLNVLGCQCCRLTEHYQDVVDCVADRSPHFDRLYCPALDLTRIGYPDWCACPLNRCLYGNCCCRDTRCQPPYIHNPMYLPPPRPPVEKPIPEGPAIEPKSNVGPDVQGDGKVPTQMQGIPDPKELESGDTLPPLPPIPEPPEPTSKSD